LTFGQRQDALGDLDGLGVLSGPTELAILLIESVEIVRPFAALFDSGSSTAFLSGGRSEEISQIWVVWGKAVALSRYHVSPTTNGLRECISPDQGSKFIVGRAVRVRDEEFCASTREAYRERHDT
jgi:hypothetical protein